MPRVDLVVHATVQPSPRILQLSGIFDAPIGTKLERSWHFDADLDAHPWSIGLIAGPSGSGKSLCAAQLFGADRLRRTYAWDARAIVDNFAPALSMRDITDACAAVGFNTIPAWCKPYAVLSNGEQFRVTVARALLEEADPIVLDEFTSMVDRQVARIAAHAVGKFVRARGRRFVAVTCHEDVEEWLQPDWVLTPHDGALRWRSLRRRPALPATLASCPRSLWPRFAPYHYMSGDLNPAAQCFAVSVGGQPVAFAGLLYRPVSHGATRPVWGVSRLVTLPDWQGLGIAMILCDHLGAALAQRGCWLHMYPAHPALIRAFARSPRWAMQSRPQYRKFQNPERGAGGRPCAIFRYVGPAADAATAAIILRGTTLARIAFGSHRSGSYK